MAETKPKIAKEIPRQLRVYKDSEGDKLPALSHGNIHMFGNWEIYLKKPLILTSPCDSKTEYDDPDS